MQASTVRQEVRESEFEGGLFKVFCFEVFTSKQNAKNMKTSLVSEKKNKGPKV